VKSNPGNASEAKQDSEVSNRMAENGSLVAALSFGCIFLFGVVLLIGKRCYDGYQRRHYSKVDYLVNGMYN
jgi:nitrate reductase gamma subunit